MTVRCQQVHPPRTANAEQRTRAAPWRRRVPPIWSLDSRPEAGGDCACAGLHCGVRLRTSGWPDGCLETAVCVPGFQFCPRNWFPFTPRCREAIPVCCTEPWKGQVLPAPSPQAAVEALLLASARLGGRPVGSQPRLPPRPGPLLADSAVTSAGPSEPVSCTHSVRSSPSAWRWVRSLQPLSSALIPLEGPVGPPKPRSLVD